MAFQWLSAIVVAVTVSGTTLASPAEEKLMHSLLENYDINTRPVARANDSLVINVSFTLVTLDNVDVDQNQVMLHGWVKLSWVDPQLRWNASAHDGIDMLSMPIESIWKPDLKLYNAPESNMQNTLAVLAPNGQLIWVPPVSGQVSCNLSAMWFPFDVQRCTIVFGSWTYDMTKIDLQLPDSIQDDGTFTQNSEWRLVSTTQVRREKKYSCCPNPYPSIEVTLTLQRKACRHVIGHVVPLVTLVTLALLTMIIPANRADVRLIIVTLLLGSAFVHLRLAADVSAPQSLSVLTLLNGQFMFVLGALFACNCVHLAVMRGHLDCSFLAKLSGLVAGASTGGAMSGHGVGGGAAGDKSEVLISDVEQRYHRALDSVFTLPLAFIAMLSTALFFSVPLF